MSSGSATARAHANIALVKYWGKRDAALNLPAAESLSLTLGALTTTTTVTFGADADSLVLDGAPTTGKALAQVSAFLDLVRARAGTDDRAAVISDNDFPTASGLASSASAYAALAVAACRAANLDLSDRELSSLARRGSGSAARSIFGGFARMRATDGDAWAEPIHSDWDVRMVIAVIGGGVAKKVSSRDAMTHCAQTSPLYDAWLASVEPDIRAAQDAIAARDLHALGRIAEGSALAMHAAALASRPTIRYFAPATLAAMQAVEAMRDDGVPAYYTMDAGPHCKVLTCEDYAETVAARLRQVADVTRTIVSAAGGPAEIV